MELVNYFFVFSIFGHILESVITTNYTSGILYGYWTPIYGVGVVIILLIYRHLVNKLKLKGIKKFIVTFIVCSFFLASIEYIAGILIELIFNKTFWDYSNHKFNLGKYTSLEMAFCWGILSIVLIYLIEPFIKKYIKKIPKTVSYILIILFIIDVFATILLK